MSAAASVGADGLLSCGNATNQIVCQVARLSVGTAGRVDIGAANSSAILVSPSVTMSRGQIVVAKDSRLSLAGLVTMSTAQQSATIDGEGIVQLTQPNTIVDTQNGPQFIDLRIGASIDGIALTLNGSGVTQFAGVTRVCAASTCPSRKPC